MLCPKMPQSSPVNPAMHVQLSVRTLARDIHCDSGGAEGGREVEENKISNKNSNYLQRIFRSTEASLLEVK